LLGEFLNFVGFHSGNDFSASSFQAGFSAKTGGFSTEIEDYQQEERLRPVMAADNLEESQQGSSACTKVKSTVF
jgi:hypothetical protein